MKWHHDESLRMTGRDGSTITVERRPRSSAVTDKKKTDETPEALQARAGEADPGVTPVGQRPDVEAIKDAERTAAAEAARQVGQGQATVQVSQGVADSRDVAARRGDEGFDPDAPNYGGLTEPDLPPGTMTAATQPLVDPYTGEKLPGADDSKAADSAKAQHDASVRENEAAAERKKKNS